MTRAPFAFGKTDEAFSRTPPKVFDTTLGWRFENPRMAARFPLLSMGETAEEVATKWAISREEQDAFALASQKKAAAAIAAGRVRPRDCAGAGAAEEGRAGALREGRVAPGGHDAGGPGEAAHRRSARAAR